MKDGMELFTKGMELAENMRGDGGDSWISVFKEMAKQLPVGEILQNLSQMKQQPNNQQRRQLLQPIQPQMNLNGRGGTNFPETQLHVNNSPAATGQELEQSMRYLIGKAQRNADPELYAEWLLDNADKALIRQMANDPNVLDQLAVIFPIMNNPNIRGWFSELVQGVKEYLAQMGETEDSAPGIVPTSDMNGADARPASDASHDPGWSAGDQNHPENNAGVG